MGRTNLLVCGFGISEKAPLGISNKPLLQSLHHYFFQLLQPRRHVRQMHAQSAPPAVGQDLEIAAGLRRLDHAESVFLSGNGQVGCVIAGNLQEDAAVRAAFVGLPGRMQKARAKAKTGGYAMPVANSVPDGLQPLFMRSDISGTLVGAFDAPGTPALSPCGSPRSIGERVSAAAA